MVPRGLLRRASFGTGGRQVAPPYDLAANAKQRGLWHHRHHRIAPARATLWLNHREVEPCVLCDRACMDP